MNAGSTRRAQWREQGVINTAVARRHNGRSVLQYVRCTRVNQRDLPDAETDWDATPEQLPADVAHELGFDRSVSERLDTHETTDATEATQ